MTKLEKMYSFCTGATELILEKIEEILPPSPASSTKEMEEKSLNI